MDDKGQKFWKYVSVQLILKLNNCMLCNITENIFISTFKTLKCFWIELFHREMYVFEENLILPHTCYIDKNWLRPTK